MGRAPRAAVFRAEIRVGAELIPFMMWYTISYYTATVCRIISYYIILYHITLCYIVLYHIASDFDPTDLGMKDAYTNQRVVDYRVCSYGLLSCFRKQSET